MRLDEKTAVIIGAGQGLTSGEIIGNGRATAITFARWMEPRSRGWSEGLDAGFAGGGTIRWLA